MAGVTGKPRFDGRDSVLTALSMAYRHAEWMRVPAIPIESPQVAALFGLDTNHRHRVSAGSLMRHPAGQRYIMGYLTNGDSALHGLSPQLQKGVKKLAFRVATLLNVPHEFRIVPLGDMQGLMASPFVLEDPALDPQAAAQLERARVSNELVAAAVRLHAALRDGLMANRVQRDEIERSVQDFEKLAQQVSGYPVRWKRELDRWYSAFHPFQRAAQVYWFAVAGFLLSIAALVRLRRFEAQTAENGNRPIPTVEVGGVAAARVELIAGSCPPRKMHEELQKLPRWGRWSYWAAVGALSVAALLMLSGLVARYFLGGRIPVSNMYESITFTMAAFGLMGVAFETAYRRAWIGLVVALAGTFCMTMANSMPLHMRKVEPLVAVLNSVWLNYHVTSLLISYAAFLLSFLFALGYFLSQISKGRLAFLPSPEALEKLCYRSVLLGWPLLTLGIILGAVWANTAWGRYWSWDPKETWAFITWLTYTIYLHLRMVRGWRGRWSVAASKVGFLMVLITYFGVSYLPGLAGGLHSYAQPISR
ncbi:MAG: c-type cytochrome biogenesis protein CcsB [Candidatus Sumerlaeaceae bacterium]